MPCPHCDDTGWRAIESDGGRRVERCDCWRQGLTTRLIEDARVPPRYKRCDLETFVTYPNEKLLGAVRYAQRFADGRRGDVISRWARPTQQGELLG